MTKLFTFLPRPLRLLLVAGALLFNNGCVTSRQVQSIISESNAAMVTPFLGEPGGAAGGDSWRGAVTKIDQLIAAHPGEATLVNHLKVRQAMILTVNRQDSLAELRWQGVDRARLQTDRDRALYDCRATLVWWYKRAAQSSALAGGEKTQALAGLDEFTRSIAATTDPETKILLGTARAQISLKLANQARVITDADRQAVARDLADALSSFVGLFSPDEVEWVRLNKTADLPVVDLEMLATLRHRVWLRRMIGEYRKTAAGQEVDPAWAPNWIQSY